MNIEYGSLIHFSSGGKTPISIQSKIIVDKIKGGKPIIDQLIKAMITRPEAAAVLSMFGKNTTIIPAPRSSPSVEGAQSSPKSICNTLIANGLGNSIEECLIRTYAIPRASTAAAEGRERPPVQVHIDSMAFVPAKNITDNILIVDDIISNGNQLAACYLMIKEQYPNATISTFALAKTFGFGKEIPKVFCPEVSIITYYPDSGKTFRHEPTP